MVSKTCRPFLSNFVVFLDKSVKYWEILPSKIHSFRNYRPSPIHPKDSISNQEFQWGFSLVYLHNIESSCSPWTYIAQTLNFLCVPQTPLRIWDRRQFAIGGYLIWRTEAGEYVFISSIANQVLEDEQRICTWNQYTAKGLAFWLVMKNVSSTLIGQSWSWVQHTDWFLPERPNDKAWEDLRLFGSERTSRKVNLRMFIFVQFKLF